MADLVGITVWNFRDGSLASRIERFADMGFDAVSLCARDACALCRGTLGDVEAAILEHSLAVSFNAAFEDDGSPIPIDSLLSDIELYMRWHEDTGLLHSVNYEPAFLPDEGSVQDYHSTLMHHALRHVLSVSNGAGFSIGVRDWPRNKEQLEQVADLRAYPHMGIVLDLGALNIRARRGAGQDPIFPLNSARRYLDRINLPIHEVRVHNNDGIHDLHAPPIAGTADIAALVEMLRRRGVRGISTVDIVPSLCGLAEDEAWSAAAEALRFCREVG
ncbi:MAG: hypothetical protein ABFD54_14435 [Armatimonadota bacterium]|nr:sugar phosphate isomerase/epimerase [bacterium]